MKKTRYYTQFKRSMNNYHSYFNSDEGKKFFGENNKLGYLLGMVIYYDTLNNDSINELVKKINKLDKKNYKVSYSRFGSSKYKQYIQFQNTSSSTGIFCEIKLLNNKWIDSINIHWAQRSNYNAIFEFRIILKNNFNTFKDEYEFIKSCLKLKNKNNTKYFYYFDINHPKYEINKNFVITFHYDLLRFSFQTLIDSLLYTENGQETELLSFYSYQTDKESFESIKPAYLGLLLKKKEANTFLYIDSKPSSFHQKFSFDFITLNGVYLNIDFLSYFANYRNIFYYNLYFYYELNKLNNQFSMYSVGSNKSFSRKNLMKLYNKLVELESSRDTIEYIDVEELNEEINKIWTLEHGVHDRNSDKIIGEKDEIKFTLNKVQILLEKYKEQYDFYKIALSPKPLL